MNIEKTIREEVKNTEKAVHGGDVWAYNKGLLDFSSNINPFGPSKKALKCLEESLWKLPYYPDPDSNKLKKAISEYLEINKKNITVGNGSTEIIKNFLELVIRKGDRVIISEPTFSEYEVYSRLYGAEIKHIYSKEENNFSIKTDEIVREIDDKTKVVFICNPNNPTGQIIDSEGLEKIIISARDHGAFVFVDEAYIEFTKNHCMVGKIRDYENLFILRSVTKFFSLAGLRIGFGIGDETLVDGLEKIRIPWNVNILAQEVAEASLNDEEFIKDSKRRLMDEKEFLKKEISKIEGIKIINSNTNFFLINIEESNIRAKELKNRLLEDGILIRDCTSFNGLDDRFIRISVRTREENTLLIKNLKEVLMGA